MMMMMMMIIIIAIIIIIVIILFYFHLFIPFFEKRRKKRTPDTFFFTSTNVFVLGEVRKRKMRTDKGSVTGIFLSKTKIRKCSMLSCVSVSYVPLHIK